MALVAGSVGDGCLAKAVADGRCGQKILWMGRIVFNAFPQFADVGSEVFDVVFVLGSPDGAQNFLVRDGSTLTAHEQVKDVELCAGKRNGVASLEEDSAIAAEGYFSIADGSIGQGR